MREGESEMAGEQPTGATLGLSFAATLPLRSLPRFTASELLAAVNDTLSQDGTAAELVPKLTVFQEEDLTGRIWHRPKSPPRIGLKLSGVVLLI